MFGTGFEGVAARVLSLILVGWGVRWLDDGLDWPRDRAMGRPNWVRCFGRGIHVYAALVLVLAAGVHAATAVPVFLASYGLGMLATPGEKEPSGLKGWQETLLVVFVSLVLVGPVSTLAAMLAVATVQLLDDWWERREERDRPDNWASRLGSTETLLLSLFFLTLTVGLDSLLAAGALLTLLSVHWYPNAARPRPSRSPRLRRWLDEFGGWEGREP